MSEFDALRDDFVLEVSERANRVESLLLDLESSALDARQSILDDASRELHTLKGNSGMMGRRDLQRMAHEIEDMIAAVDTSFPSLDEIFGAVDRMRTTVGLAPESDAGVDSGDMTGAGITKGRMDSAAGSIRVPFDQLDSLVDLLSEMVIFRNRLANAIDSAGARSGVTRELEEIAGAHEALSKTLALIQDRVMRLRMVPLETLFRSLRRIVRDESAREGKQVRFVTSGGDTPMDKALLETAHEALGHVVRNAVVHGIETSDRRAEAGKSGHGQIRLSALTHSNEVWIDIEDDGRGIDVDAVSIEAAARGLSIGDGSELFSVLFQPGFTTRNGTDIAAGRGMGLSAVQEAIQRVGGRAEVSSAPGEGCRVRLRLPLSVSITRALLMRVDGEEYALPVSSIVETQHFTPDDRHVMNHAGVMVWRRDVVPVLDLGCVMKTSDDLRSKGFVVLIEADARLRGLVVDGLIGIREIVVKSLDPVVGTPRGVGGSTILGDGRVLLILDPRGLTTIEPFIDTNAPPAPEEESS